MVGAGAGATTVTVIHGYAEEVLAVKVALPSFGVTAVGLEGTIVANSDGYMASIGPGQVRKHRRQHRDGQRAASCPAAAELFHVRRRVQSHARR